MTKSSLDWNNGIDCENHGSTPSNWVDSNLNLLGWYIQNSDSTLHRVGLKQPNALGFYDFHGNSVWERCLDGITGRSTADATDPVGGTGEMRVFKGGSFTDRATWCRSSTLSNEHVSNQRGSFRVFFNIRDYLGD